MLDFPNSPTNGQIFTGPGGVQWVWDTQKWINGTGVAAYAPIASPVFTGDPQAPTAAAGDSDTSVATTAFVSAAVGTALHGIGRNYIHNPLFNVAQRGVGPFTTGAYTLDRWQTVVTTDTISITQIALADADRAAIGDEQATFALQNVFTGNAAAGAFNAIQQPIETARRLSGKTVITSFWAKAASGTPKVGVAFYQNFGTGGSPSAGLQGTGTAVTLSTAWARYAVTTTIPSSAAKVMGTNNNDATNMQLWFSSGATNNASAGGIGVQSGTIQLWGVQLETGGAVTSLEKPDPRYDISNCQRFYQTGAPVMFGSGIAANAFGYSMTIPAMRALPTVVIGTNTSSNLGSYSASAVNSATILVTGVATATAATGLNLQYTASADI